MSDSTTLSVVDREKLKRVRGEISRLFSEIEKSDVEELPDDKKNYYSLKIEKFESDVLSLNNLKLNSLEMEDEIAAEISKQFDYDDKILKMKAVIRTSIDNSLSISSKKSVKSKVHSCRSTDESKSPANPTVNVMLPSASFPSQPTSGASRGSNVKLPKQELAEFHGGSTEWNSFWNLFSVQVHNKDISAVEKFTYLMKSLKGEAKRVIQGLSICEENYVSAVQLLQERFGNTDRIISLHLNNLLNLKSISPGCGVREMRQFYDNVNVELRGLELIGFSDGNTGKLIVHQLIGKLPHNLRLQMAKSLQRNDKSWTIGIFLKNMLFEIEAAEAACMGIQSSNPDGGSLRSSSGQFKNNHPRSLQFNGPSQRHRGLPPSAATLVANSNSIFCSYCEGSHASKLCRRVATLQDRLNFLRQRNLCFNCLREGHRVLHCRSRSLCHVCRKKHHESICNQRNSGESTSTHNEVSTQRSFPARSTQSTENTMSTSEVPIGGDESQSTPESTQQGVMSYSCVSNKLILLQTAKVHVVHPLSNQQCCARVLLDTGSTRSYIRTSVCESLKLPVLRTERLVLNTFGCTQNEAHDFPVVSLGILTRSNEVCYMECLQLPELCGAVPSSSSTVKYSFGHLPFEDLDLADYPGLSGESIDILIGSDYYATFILPEMLKDPMYPSLTAQNSKLGWLIFGVSGSTTNSTNSSCFTSITSSEPELWQTVQKFYDVESIGISDRTPSVYDEFESQISRDVDGRFIVRLPIKEETIKRLPSHKDVCLRRLNAIYRRGQRDVEFLRRYNDVIKEQLKLDIIEVALPSENSEKMVHFLPHHPVIKEERVTTKIRVVFDGSFKTNKQSVCINDCLHTGPNLMPELLKILVRFRMHKVVVVADISKAFSQIAVHKDDRDLLRFVWYKNLDGNTPSVEEYRFARLPFGLNCSPFLFTATTKFHVNSESVKQKFPDTSQILNSDLYVDDLVSGEMNVERAVKLCTEAKQVLSSAGMSLCKFKSNSSELLSLIGCEAEMGLTKILGQFWIAESDHLTFDASNVVKSVKSKPTKRMILKSTAQIFDPLGLICPIVIVAKCLFSDVCKEDKEWDESLSSDVTINWQNWIKDLENVTELKFLRSVVDFNNLESFELHGFADASTKAYSAVIYVRCIYSDGRVQCNLLCAKSRVAPKKVLSVPRLELLAALILSRLISVVHECLSLLPYYSTTSRITLWSDSQTVLCWLNNENEWKQWVKSRIREIHSILPNSCEWRYVRSEVNPADIPSRGSTVEKLKQSCWLKGPRFLYDSPDVRTFDPESKENVAESEMKTTVLAVVESNSIIDYEKFSSFSKLLKTVSFVLKFVRILKAKIRKESFVQISCVEEIRQAELFVMREIQRNIMINSSLQRNLNVFEDDKKILRCKGRLNWSGETSYNANNPILLPKNHHVAKLIVLESHAAVMHSGVAQTLSQVRQRFWLITGRNLVRRVLRNCVVCQRLQGTSYANQVPPPLPDFRSSQSHVFQNVGFDFFGPLLIKENSVSVKVWIGLFACCVTRAVHLEVCRGQSTEEVLSVIRKFVARRGLPSRFITDNAKTFVKLSNYFSEKRIEWKRIVERAAWWGGFYERLVGITKNCLKKLLGRTVLSFDELVTYVCEVEAVVNSRPLTYVDGEDIEPLTPGHFLICRPFTTIPEGNSTDVNSSSNRDVRNCLMKRSLMMKQFWFRWRREYLLSLREKWRNNGDGKISAKVDDIVIIGDTKPRLLWQLGKVIETNSGSDGVVRSAMVKTRNGILRRSIRHLFPLEF